MGQSRPQRIDSMSTENPILEQPYLPGLEKPIDAPLKPYSSTAFMRGLAKRSALREALLLNPNNPSIPETKKGSNA